MVLVPYLRALMAGGMWELALQERQRHHDVLEDDREQPDLVKLGVKLGGSDAVADAVVCHGLVDNGQPGLALEEVLRVLRSRPEVRAVCATPGFIRDHECCAT